MIYVIQGMTSGRVKVGFTASIVQRFADLSCGLWEELRIVYLVHGDLAEEQALLKVLAPWSERGEWFFPSAGLWRAIELWIQELRACELGTAILAEDVTAEHITLLKHYANGKVRVLVPRVGNVSSGQAIQIGMELEERGLIKSLEGQGQQITAKGLRLTKLAKRLEEA